MDKQNILNKSTINNEKSLLSLPVEKLDEYIILLEEFQNKCEVEAKFVEADLAQKKIAQLIKIKNKKNVINRKNQQIEERELENLEKFCKLVQEEKQLDILTTLSGITGASIILVQ